MKQSLLWPSLLALALSVALLVAGFSALALGRSVEERHIAALASPSRVEERTLYSEALGAELPYSVYLPEGYDSDPLNRYPVLYMLHGMGGDYEEWQRCGLFETADQLIADGEIEPMIIVTPEGGRSYWMDQAGGGPRFGTYVTDDLVRAIDSEFRTIDTPDARAIGGMSMGGHGALQLAINSPGTFGIVGSHSVALRTFDQALPAFGDAATFRAHNPVQLFKQESDLAKELTIWIDIGADDQWLAAANTFHKQLVADGIAHEWHVFTGGHDLAYWSAHAADYLRFYSGAFATKTEQPAAAALTSP